MDDDYAIRKPKLAPASHCSFGHETDLNTSSNNWATLAQKTLLTICHLILLRTTRGGSEGGEQRWCR